MSEVREVTDGTFEEDVIREGKPVLVDFYADWCPPCRAMAPILEGVAGELEKNLKVVKLDVDANPAMTRRYGVASLPTMLLFRDGKPVAQITGAKPKDALVRVLEPHLPGQSGSKGVTTGSVA